MKPPLRPRLAPARYVTGPGAAAEPEPGRPRAAWSVREKRALLAALRAQAALGLPAPQPRPLRERLPRRSEAEILAFLCRLRGRAAREAVCTQYRHCLEQQRRRHAQVPAPIEVWLELAETLAEGLEEPTAAAFSQPCAPEGFAVDFQRVYEYLARLCRGGKGPALPPAESAVVLALLGSLPQELGALDCAGLRSHLRGAYGSLTAPQPPGTAPPAPPDGWSGLGLCPLNLFLVPLRLLARAEAPG
ncbi:snRNA-activating protein complex subunit 2 [Pelecanus crispus]|uniref:snRNA-activating protein complex subunit 2 n=1 Tax=Pelecanus crispus TaxID=36300 RepID=UPI003F5D26B6